MVGAGLLTLPWAFFMSGLVLGQILTFIAFAISFYTCWMVLKVGHKDDDFTDTLRKYYGKFGRTSALLVYIVNFFVPLIIYFQLLAQNLYPLLLPIADWIAGEDEPNEGAISTGVNFQSFSYTYTCCLLFIVMFLFAFIKD
eukprot:CAMPEP_0202964884 /NCGR_PEP_ID=MMETSP1396-20130829/9008_1 /ASSEMBLY_ACC=CAM_ASM_000872 /TAXON_ID= /ORGANISM="Pseudokeronopsis sp., Strain Brazil" /LENGTH=140 /DNA_ID=CAMNT_0049687369 /DNA_START=56 /DNA_END=478 /DNA_ORIENTATION=+